MSYPLVQLAKDEQRRFFGLLEVLFTGGPTNIAAMAFDFDPALPESVFDVVTLVEGDLAVGDCLLVLCMGHEGETEFVSLVGRAVCFAEFAINAAGEHSDNEC